MKKTDIAMIILIVTVSAGVAYFAASAFFGNRTQQTVKVKTINKIVVSNTEPDTSIFNSNAINPAVQVEVNASSTDTSQ